MTPDAIEKAAAEAQNIRHLTTAAWHQLGIAFLFGSGTSLLWILREGKRKPRAFEVVSSALSTGVIAVACAAWLLDYNISMGKMIFISIMCGLSGDTLVRVLVAGFIRAARVASGADSNDKN